MKTFKKVLASTLAAAMVVTALPVTPANAAAAPKLSTTKAAVYVGQSKTIKVTTPKTWKSVKVKATTSKKSVAKVKASKKKVTVKAVKAGTAKVTVKVTGKKSGKAVKKTLKATITVKNSSISMKGDSELLIGAEKSYKATVKPSVKVSYKSSDEAIATVDTKGNVKGVKAGKVTITATAKVGTKTIKATKDIVVKNGITEFKATTPKKLTVKFAGALETVAKENFTLTDAKGAKVAIQKATLDETKTIVTLDLYSELTTATDYTVSAKVGEDTFTETLTFVKGAVAKIVAANQIVKADGTPQQIKYTVLDENGLDITDSTAVSFSSNVTTITPDGKITLADGVLAYVTITYVNPTTGAEIKSETFSVTGSTSAAASIAAVTVGSTSDTGATLSAWPKNATTTIAKNATGLKLFAQYVNQYGDKVVATNGTDVSYESLDPSILIVDTKTGALTPIAEGAAQIKVTSGTASQLFTITVVAPATASKMALDASSVLKASMTNSSVNTASVKINVLDQNGKNFNDDTDSNVLTFTLTSGAGVLSEASTVGATVSGTAGVAKTFTAAKAGTATFKVTSNKTGLNYVMVSITVYGTDNTVVKYGLTGIKDLNIQDCYDGDSNTNDYKTTVEVKALNKDGFVVAASEVSGAAITVTKPDKTQVPLASSADNFDATASAFSAVGAYSIVATKNGTTIATATINVKDTGVKPAVTIKKNSIDYTEIAASANNILDNFTTETGWTVTGVKFVSGNSAAIASAPTAATSITKTGTDSVTLYNVVVVVRNTASNRTFEVATNQSITVK